MFRKLCCALALASGAPALAEQYICVSEVSSGVLYDVKINKWRAASFKAGDRYVLSQDEAQSWILKKLGDEDPSSTCKDGFSDSGWLQGCEDQVHDFTFNKNSLRFQLIYKGGYVKQTRKFKDLESHTPTIQIGKCAGF